MAKTTNIKFGDGNTEKDGVNAHVAYTPMSEKEKDAAMKQLIKDLHSGKKGTYKSHGNSFNVNKMR